ncbi:hypothetical protein PPGU19_081430 (plasmid) [Paraburkholderia sp. PGU19]|nr:hypothetical protein PPGU19_081430 [Paraburkholderia sp. PGU19]
MLTILWDLPYRILKRLASLMPLPCRVRRRTCYVLGGVLSPDSAAQLKADELPNLPAPSVKGRLSDLEALLKHGNSLRTRLATMRRSNLKSRRRWAKMTHLHR